MKCRDVKNSVFMFMGDELKNKKLGMIKKHIEECEECREFYEATSRTMDSLQDDMYAPSSYIRERILYRAKQRHSSQAHNKIGTVDMFFSRIKMRGVLVYSGIAVIFMLTALYITNMKTLNIKNTDPALVWEDNFLQNIDAIERDVDQFGRQDNIFAAFAEYDDESVVFTKNFVSIRKKIIKLSINN